VTVERASLTPWEDATPDVLAATHQTWLRDRATGNYLLEIRA